MTEPLPIVLVGFGAIAQDHLAAMRASDAVRAIAVVDPGEPARERAAHAGLPLFTDLERFFAARLPAAAALLATPPDRHEPLALRLLGHCLHVLVEKPFALHATGARTMLDTARTAGRRVMLCSKFRYGDDVVAARRLLDQGAIGDVVRYDNVFTGVLDLRGRWHAERAVAGGGVLMDNGSHAFDLARCLLGPLRRVHATFGRQLAPLAVEDNVHVTFESAAGALGTIDLSWSVHHPVDHYARLCGSRGTIELGWRSARWRPQGEPWRPLGTGYTKLPSLQAQLADFAACVRGDTAGRITDVDALAAVTAVEGAYRSAAEGRWVELPALP